MKDFNPKVSIVIPVYNGSNFLSQAIDSALSQTYENIEVVVVNDGSTDDGATDKIAKSYGDRISYFVKENGGVATALNFGISKMRGSYFSWLSHDDMYEKHKIEEQVKYLESTDLKDTIVATNVKVLFKNGVKKRENIDNQTFEFTDIFLSTSAVVGVNGCSLLIPKKALVDSDGFDANLPVTQDYDLWFRLCKNYKFHLVEEHLVISRRHDQQDSVQKQQLCFEAAEELHYNFLKEIPYERFSMFFSVGKRNIKSYLDNYHIYKVSGYKKTASMMLKNLLLYFSENDMNQFNELFSAEIGKIGNHKLLVPSKSKKRIMIFSNVWNRGGIERVLSFIFTHYENKYDFILATYDNKTEENMGYLLPSSVSWLRINDRDQHSEIMNAVSLFEVDLFIGNPNYSLSFLDIYAQLKNTNTKTIAYNHGHYFLPYTTGEYLYPIALKMKDSYKAADYVVLLSEIACNIYNLDNTNGLYIANPARIIEGQRAKQSTMKKLLSVGRFDDEIKQIDKILLLFKALHEIDSSYHLDIVGYCPMNHRLPRYGGKTLKKFITNENIPIQNVKFWGEQKDVDKFYDSADFLLLASRREGFALVLVEAMSKGIPCAALEYLGVEEIIQNGVNGWIRGQDDITALAGDINNTINSKQHYQAMSKNAIESMRKYDEGTFYEKWDRLFDEALGSSQNDDLELLKPQEIKPADYKRIVLECEKIMDNLTAEVVGIRKAVADSRTRKESSLYGIAKRFIVSIKRDGVLLTCEKVGRKIYSKLKK